MGGRLGGRHAQTTCVAANMVGVAPDQITAEMAAKANAVEAVEEAEVEAPGRPPTTLLHMFVSFQPDSLNLSLSLQEVWWTFVSRLVPASLFGIDSQFPV